MAHIGQVSRKALAKAVPAVAAKGLIRYPNPNCLPLGYVEGIQSGGGSLVEVLVVVVKDQFCGLFNPLR
jgi:hypothetical protein